MPDITVFLKIDEHESAKRSKYGEEIYEEVNF